MSQIHSIKLTTKDAKVNRWLEHQNNKSRSLELAIKLMIARYGEDDLFNGAITRLLADETVAREEVEDVVNESVQVIEKPVVKTKTTTTKKVTPKPKKVEVKEDEPQLDPRALLRASDDKPQAKKDDVIDMSEDDILSMFSNQSQNL